MPQRPKIAILLLGGTIVCTYDAQSNQLAPGLDLDALLKSVPGLSTHFDVTAREVENIPGTQLTPAHALKLVGALEPLMTDPEIAGTVVIQGTDTLDEISYLVSLLLPSPKPIVFTGAMKGQGELYQDAAGNIFGAAQTAAQKGLRGVLVYMNQLIFSAADVEKFHSNRMDAFQSFRGPVGAVENLAVQIWRQPEETKTYPVRTLTPRVPIVKCYAGMDDLLIRAAVDAGCDGLVVEGFGSGNVQPAAMEALKDARRHGMAVVITTRCFSGATFASFDYDGGGADLADLGVVFTGGLSSQKARLRLMVLLASGVSADAMASAF